MKGRRLKAMNLHLTKSLYLYNKYKKLDALVGNNYEKSGELLEG